LSGWQTQPDRSAVQDSVEQALAAFSGVPLATTCAGRTDAGVHATAQVIHADVGLERAMFSWVRGVNRFLPPAIAVRWARAVPDSFHARYSAIARRYDYWLFNDPVRSPLAAGKTGWVTRALDVAAMQVAGRLLVGRHDFSAFRAAECQSASPVRVLYQVAVSRCGPYVAIRTVANAFLQHMVRNIVGSLVYVGIGRKPPGWIAEVLAARDRNLAAPTFAACGLYLSGVHYPAQFELPCGVDVEPHGELLRLLP
jgi:tRNA pseudouridine38-40 synthase